MNWRWPAQDDILRVVEPLIYGKRRLTFIFLLIVTAVMGYYASRVTIDAGFSKQIPLDHPYMQTFRKYQKDFGGANFIAISLENQNGDIYSARFLDRLKKVTDAVFFLPGVDRSRVKSLFTPGVRYIQITETGFTGGDVVPRNYQPSPQMMAMIRRNVARAGQIGQLVSNDQHGALIVAELLEHNPITGKKLDYRKVAAKLEQIRQQYQSPDIKIHIIGFAKIIGDVTDAATEVVGFFVLALLLSLALLWLFCGSFRLSLLPLGAALTAVVWEFGLLHLAGLGLDPFAILVPFLILSIGVSHGVQYINAWGNEVAENGHDSLTASRLTFRMLAIPGTTAILTDAIGFATITLINIDIIQEMAINASLGMAAVIITNKVMLPIVLSWVHLDDVEKYRRHQQVRYAIGEKFWRPFSHLSTPRGAVPAIAIALALLAWSCWKYPDLQIGNMKPGVPELRPDGRYNRDARSIASNFAIGVDVLRVIAEAKPNACIDYATMRAIDRYVWHMQNTEGVRSVMSLASLARRIHREWNEGSLKWASLPQGRAELAQAIQPVPSSAGLQNPDCSVMPILVFSTDHRAKTLDRLIQVTKDFNRELHQQHPDLKLNLALASGNLGVMAATNEEIKKRELQVVFWVYAIIGIAVFLSFRSLSSLVSIIGPLALCSMLTYAFMASVGIGEKPATLPVVAFGVGIGVDDGIYLWMMLAKYLRAGNGLRESWYQALRHTGKAVVFTSLALIVSVATWLLSGLQFQADMGLLLLFMFTSNLFGAIFLLPALAWLTVRPSRYHQQQLA